MAVFDGWSLVHLGSGVVASLLGLNGETWLMINFGVEIVESIYRQVRPETLAIGEPEEIGNILVDVGLSMGSWWFTEQLKGLEA